MGIITRNYKWSKSSKVDQSAHFINNLCSFTPYLGCLKQRFVADSCFIEACIQMQGNTVPVKHMSSTNQHTNLSKCRYYTPKCAQITCPLFDMVIKESNQYVVKGSTFVYSSNKTFLKFIEQLSISLSAMLPCFDMYVE